VNELLLAGGPPTMETRTIAARTVSENRLRATYPSYVSFDRLIDLERLLSLDQYLRSRIKAHIASQNESLFLNQHRLEPDAPHEPGVREIWLKKPLPGVPYDYMNINRTELWEVTRESRDFTMLMDFVETLPFSSTGRILIIYDDGQHEVPAHRDHEFEDVCHDFIWFRTSLNKPFYLLDHRTGEKMFVDGYSAWFDTVNQYHGSTGAQGLNFSFRVDGHFTEAFRSRITGYRADLAASPAVWATSLGGCA
jgi:hypothetical protein